MKKAEPSSGTGVMVALRPPTEVADRLAVPDGTPPGELHVTLGYLGRAADLPDGFADRLRVELEALGLSQTPALGGTLGGIAQFPEGDDGTPVWVPVDVPGLTELRQQVVDACARAGVPARSDYGYTPHLTLGYDLTVDPVPATPVVFTDVWMVVAGDWVPFPLGGLETKTAPPPNPGPADIPVDGKPVSPDEEHVPTETDPDADPRAVSPDGATGYFSDQWGEMTAWFYDDGPTMVGYISTPQEVIRVDDIDEWAREVDEAGLERADPPTGGGNPPDTAGDGPDAAPAPADGPATGDRLDLSTFEGGLFDFSDLEGKHLPGEHNQRRHGNRYGISAGKRVLRRVANTAGPRRQPGGAPSTYTPRSTGGDPLRRRPGPPPAPPKQKLRIEPDTDARRPFDPKNVNSLQDLWEMNTDEASDMDLFDALLRAQDPDLKEELALLHEQKLSAVLAAAREEKKDAAYKRMLEKEKYRKKHGSALEGDMTDLDALRDTFNNEVVPQRMQEASKAVNGWFWTRKAKNLERAGKLRLPPPEDIFAGRLPKAFSHNWISEELKDYWNRTGTTPIGFNAWAGIGKNADHIRRDAAAGGDLTWDDAPARKDKDRRRR